MTIYLRFIPFTYLKNDKLIGDCAELRGNCTELCGDCTGLIGDCSKLIGDCTGLSGDCTELRGNFNDCELTEKERKYSINNLIKMEK